MTDHRLSIESPPAALSLILKGSCSCGRWSFVAHDRERIRSFFDTHALMEQFSDGK